MRGFWQLEMDRMDIYHKLLLVVRNEDLFWAPFMAGVEAPRVLDLGTGTGIWAIDLAE